MILAIKVVVKHNCLWHWTLKQNLKPEVATFHIYRHNRLQVKHKQLPSSKKQKHLKKLNTEQLHSSFDCNCLQNEHQHLRSGIESLKNKAKQNQSTLTKIGWN